MTNTAPYAGRPNPNTEETVNGLRDLAKRLSKSLQVSRPPADVQRLVYGNFCDAATWDEVSAWVYAPPKEIK
jgi:hypothetical protein